MKKKKKDKCRVKAKMRKNRPTSVKSGAGTILQFQNGSTIQLVPASETIKGTSADNIFVYHEAED